MAAVFGQNQTAHWNGGAVKAARWQADHCVHHIQLPHNVGADGSLRPASKQHPVGQQHGGAAIFLHVVDHVLEKGKILVGFGRQPSRVGETGVRQVGRIRAPLLRVRGIGHLHRKFQLVKMVSGNGVTVVKGKLTAGDAVDDHVHAGQVVGGAVFFLAVEMSHSGPAGFPDDL